MGARETERQSLSNSNEDIAHETSSDFEQLLAFGAGGVFVVSIAGMMVAILIFAVMKVGY